MTLLLLLLGVVVPALFLTAVAILVPAPRLRWGYLLTLGVLAVAVGLGAGVAALLVGPVHAVIVLAFAELTLALSAGFAIRRARRLAWHLERVAQPAMRGEAVVGLAAWLGRLRHGVPMAIHATVALLERGHHDEAVAVADALDPRPDRYFGSRLHTLAAYADLLRGEREAARQRLAEVEAAPPGTAPSLARALQAVLWAAEDGSERAAAALAELPARLSPRAEGAAALARAHLAAERPEEARGQLRALAAPAAKTARDLAQAVPGPATALACEDDPPPYR